MDTQCPTTLWLNRVEADEVVLAVVAQDEDEEDPCLCNKDEDLKDNK